MTAMEGATLAQLKTLLYQADGILIVSLKTGEGRVPDALQNALWGATSLIEQALAVADSLKLRCDGLEHGGGI